jgi:hypothetical protein
MTDAIKAGDLVQHRASEHGVVRKALAIDGDWVWARRVGTAEWVSGTLFRRAELQLIPKVWEQGKMYRLSGSFSATRYECFKVWASGRALLGRDAPMASITVEAHDRQGWTEVAS